MTRAVAWEDLTCATGSAAGLPALVARIGSADRDEALAALAEARACLWRDGAIFEATAAAVPLLVELALDPAGLVRPPVLQLLAFLHGGEAPSAAALRAGEEGGEDGPAFRARLAVENGWVEATRTAVRRRLFDYLSLMGDEDRDVRIAAACLATVFRDRDAEPEVRRALSKRVLEEPDEVVRATVLGALNVYLPSSHLELYDNALESDPSLLVRREAAHSLAAVLRGETPRLAVATLLEAVLQAAELEPLYAGVAWNRRGLVADSMWALLRLGAAAQPFLRILEKIIRRIAPADALAVAEVALLLAFEEPAASRAFGELAPEQLSVLHAVVDTDGLWGQELPRMLAHYGLPREQATLRAFLSRS